MPGKLPGMVRWRARLFAVLARNAQRAAAFLGLPPNPRGGARHADGGVRLSAQEVSAWFLHIFNVQGRRFNYLPCEGSGSVPT